MGGRDEDKWEDQRLNKWHVPSGRSSSPSSPCEDIIFVNTHHHYCTTKSLTDLNRDLENQLANFMI